jgi:putative ABC transport system permease protein
MLDIAFKDFKAKKGRTAMCIIGVMVCVLLIGTVNLVLYEMESGLKGDLGTVNGQLYFEKNGTSFPPYASIIPQTLGDEVLKRAEVDPAKSTEALFAPVQTGESAQYTMIVGVTPGKEQAFLENATVNGKSSLVGEGDNAVIVGSEAAKKYNATVGGTITVQGNQYKVVGIMKQVGSGWPLTIDNSLVMPLSHAQAVMDMSGLISTVIITPSGSIDGAETSLQDAYPSYTIYSQKDTQKTLDDNLSQIRIFMNMISTFIFLVSVIIIMIVMMMSVKEKTKEIGTMRAIGTSKMKIMALIIYESLILSLVGGIVGIILMSPTYSMLGLLMGVDEVNFLSFNIPGAIVLQVLVIVFVIGTFSGLIPAYLATRISPIDALRYE